MFDVAVIGSGYAGSLAAMIARRLGRSVVMVERGRHPRVVIGESSTPLSNLLLETLADRYDLPRVRPLAKWGSWQAAYPGVGCGLKRGFTFQHQGGGRMLVEASPRDAIADTHWFRADTDAFLVEEARALGVEYVDCCALEPPVREGDGWLLRGPSLKARAGLILDASGARGYLYRSFGLGEADLPGYPAISAVWSHFTGVAELGGAGPFPPDAAAVHHVFPGGWAWVLRFGNGWVSAGSAAFAPVAERWRFREGAEGWARVCAAIPALEAQFAGARALRPFTFAERLPFRSARMAGPGWALLPGAAGFVDPLFSTGFPLSLLGLERLGRVLEGASSWEAYARECRQDLLAAGRLVGALYAHMGEWEAFRTLSLLYFAAASWAETLRRLGRPGIGFLLWGDPEWGPESRAILEEAAAGRVDTARVFALVARFDVAGLSKRPLDDCYPVRVEDLYAGAGRLGASPEELRAMLLRAGLVT